MRTLCISTLFLAVFSQALAASEPSSVSPERLRCGQDRKQSIEIRPERLSDSVLVYAAQNEQKFIQYFPSSRSRYPEAVAKMQFAKACLQVTGQSADTCSAVRFLKLQGALSRRDLTELENYYLAQSNSGNKNALYDMKALFGCY